ncbi:MAG: hypothetical protein JXA37_06040 [Chloroflexia bacterium]|nr:hypothetical protein [Chloroflexia bacterium]
MDTSVDYGLLLGGGLGLIVLVAFVAGSLIWHHRRSEELLQAWAEQQGYQILSAEMRWFSRGPMFWTTSRGQTVYYVELLDLQGMPRPAWVRCGSFWWGLFSRQVEVQWEGSKERQRFEV